MHVTHSHRKSQYWANQHFNSMKSVLGTQELIYKNIRDLRYL